MNRYAKPLAGLWTLGILAACSIPGTSLPSVSLWEFDKAVHFVLFFGFGALGLWAYPKRTGWVLLAGLAYAVGTEFYQGLLPWPRTPDLYDAVANSIGLLAGVAVMHRMNRKTSRREDGVT
ncbi:MAG: VanZ family protein [Bacteroidota bacterium]